MDLPIPPTTFHLELSTVRQAYNTARIPGNTGTTFSLRDLIGTNERHAGRLTAWHALNENHGLRVLIAPLGFSGTGSFAAPVQFQGKTFAAATPTLGSYQFNSYRVSYWSTVRQTPTETWRVGGTLKARDAKIALHQGSTQASSYNFGLVPLVYLGGERRLSDQWTVLVDTDGLAAPQGRAFDVSLALAYTTSPKTKITLGVRTLEGGADNERVYNFARLNYLSLGVLWLR